MDAVAGTLTLLASLVVAGLLLAFLALHLGDERRTTRRVQAFARSRDWTFSTSDRSATDGLEYPPFDRRGLTTPRRVVRGQARGHELVAFSVELPDEGDGTVSFGVVAWGPPGAGRPLRLVPPGVDLQRWPRSPQAPVLLDVPPVVEGWTVLAPRRAVVDGVQGEAIALLAGHPGLSGGVDGGRIVLVREAEPALVLRIEELLPVLERLAELLGAPGPCRSDGSAD